MSASEKNKNKINLPILKKLKKKNSDDLILNFNTNAEKESLKI